jgi:hypothetical protein
VVEEVLEAGPLLDAGADVEAAKDSGPTLALDAFDKLKTLDGFLVALRPARWPLGGQRSLRLHAACLFDELQSHLNVACSETHLKLLRVYLVILFDHHSSL